MKTEKQPKKKAPLRVVEHLGSVITSKGTEVKSASNEPESYCKTCG